MAKKYFGETTLTALVSLIKKALGEKVNTNDIVNDTTSGGANKVLSAEAGKKLAEKIENAGYGDMLESKYAKNGGAASGKVDHALVADSATTAESASDAEKLGGALPAAYMKASDFAKNGGASDGKVDHALVADSAASATNASNAAHATEADSATNADHADSADEAEYATTAGSAETATKATNADKAADSDKLGGEAATAYLKVAQVGVANGVVPLNGQIQIDSKYLPSYVDDVIEGYYYEGQFYNEDSHTTKIEGESGKIYVDLATNNSYRYGGSAYVLITSSDMVEITAGEVTTIWNSTAAAS